VLAVLEIVDAIAPFGDRMEAEFGFDFSVRVGINTGLVVVGAVGSGQATAAGAVYPRGTLDASTGHTAKAVEGFRWAVGMFEGLEQRYDEALEHEALAVASPDATGVALLEQAIAAYSRLGASADELRARSSQAAPPRASSGVRLPLQVLPDLAVRQVLRPATADEAS